MQDVKSPSHLIYKSTVSTDGLSLFLSNDKSGRLAMGISLGGEPGSTVFTVDDSPSMPISRLELPAQHFTSETASPLFDPTWSGAHRWLRFGIKGEARGAETSGDEPPEPSAGLQIIAATAAIGSTFYNITDAGSKACPAGTAGHALDFEARTEPSLHPLIGATIDDSSHRICEMRFALSGRSGVMGATGYVDMHFADVDGYWLVTDGVVDIEARLLGIGIKHGVMTFRSSDLEVDTPKMEE